MAENSRIEWTNHTFNPWMGCTKVSPACAHCYAERDFDHRYQKVKWGPNGTRVLTSDANWRKPLQWNQEAADCEVSPRVFCASLADVFEDWQGPIHNSSGRELWIDGRGPFVRGENYKGDGRLLTMSDVRSRLFDLIDATPNLDWLLLTKRPENIRKMWPSADMFDSDSEHKAYWPNVWLGTSVENQEYADQRIPELLKCRDLSPVLFLSCEPLLGPVDLTIDGLSCSLCRECINQSPDRETNVVECQKCDSTGIGKNVLIDWVIAGGESGPDARPSHPDWFRSLRDQCSAESMAFHFKQWGEWFPTRQARHSDLSKDARKQVILRPDGQITTGFLEYGVDACVMDRIGKRAAGRILDGVTYDELPKV